jgi:hypothetical protein
MDTIAWQNFAQILLTLAIPVVVATGVGLGLQVWHLLKSKIPGNVLFQLQQVAQTVADAARQSGVLTQATAAEKVLEASLVAQAQAFADAHKIPIGSIESLTALIKAELWKDLHLVPTTVNVTATPVAPASATNMTPAAISKANQAVEAARAAIAQLNAIAGASNILTPPPTIDRTGGTFTSGYVASGKVTDIHAPQGAVSTAPVLDPTAQA